MEIFAQNNNDLFKQAVLAIRQNGAESDSANSEVNQDGTRFINGVFVGNVTYPRDRWLCIHGRNSSAIAAIGETFWVLAGRNDLEFLSRILPRAINFSDDGHTWRAAYGPRLFNHGQLDSVIDRLRKNPNTRQAYLTIYDPALDSDEGLMEHSNGKTKDMVCNFALLFDIKEGELNLTVMNRSQDVLWGMSSINFIEFTIIQEIIARVLGVQVGFYRLVSNNLHYYNNEVSQKQLTQVTEDTEVLTDSDPTPIIFRVGNDYGHVHHQSSIKTMFHHILRSIEIRCSWEDTLKTLKYWGADTGLIRDMAYALHCRLNDDLINLNEISDLGLSRAIGMSKVDMRYVNGPASLQSVLKDVRERHDAKS